MDDIVRQAMAKWPNVPACHGWLGLGARGEWFMRDDRVQAAGPFSGSGSSLQSRGAVLRHDKLIDFIGRNYAVDGQGCWFFQNGPQRVFVELEVAPWVLRVTRAGDGDYEVVTHTGRATAAQAVLCDEAGHLYMDTDAGLGLVHTLDTLVLADAIEQLRWPLRQVDSQMLPAQFGFVRSPQALHAGTAGTGQA